MGLKLQINYNIFLRKAVKGFFLLSIAFVYSLNLTYAQCPVPAGTEAIKNGGFESGNDGSSTFGNHQDFETSGKPYSNSGLYNIHADPLHFNYGFSKSFPPRGGTKMLMIDATQEPTSIFWEQTVTIFASQVYYFSAWLTSLASGESSKLQFEVKGNNDAGWTVLGPTVDAPGIGDWIQVFQTWNSGTNTSAMLRLSNYNPLGYAAGGNDFAIDDISFINNCTSVNNGPKPDLGPATISLCNNGGSINLDSKVAGTLPNTFAWYKDNVVQGNNQPVLSNVTQTGTYTVCVDSNSCISNDTIKVVAVLYLELGADSKLCSPATRTLNTGITVSANFKIVWKKDGIVVSDSTGPSFTVSGPGVYKVEVTDLAGGNCNGADSVTITSDLPVPNNMTFCPSVDPNQTFSVTGGGKYKWWTAAAGGNSVAAGLTYNATGLTGTTTYYVEDTTAFQSFAGLKKTEVSGGDQNNTATFNSILFTANQSGILDTIQVDFNAYGNGSAVATLTDLTDNSVQTKSYNVTATAPSHPVSVDIALGFTVVKGHTYKINILGDAGWGFTRFYGVFPSYPLVYDAIKITGCTGSPAVYPALLNWRLSVASECARMPVTATEDCPVNCVAPLNATLAAAGSLTVCKGNTFNQVITASISNAGAATFQYEFFNGNTIVQAASATNTYTVTQAGAYKVVVSDVANPGTCKATTNSVTFTIDSLPVLATTVIAESCAGKADGKIDLNPSGNGPFVFAWSNTASSEDLNNLAGGTYSVTVTDSKNCASTSSATITTLTLTASAIATDVLCAGGTNGSVTLTVNGGTPAFTYVWNNAAGTKDLSGIAAGPYNVTVTDSKGCTVIANATVNEPATALAASASETHVKCNGENEGAITLTVNGGTPAYSFIWNNNAVSQNLTAIGAGNYNVTVKDVNQCTTTVSVVITEPDALTLLTSSTNVTCLSQGTITAIGNGGTAPLNYSIDATNYVVSGSFSNLATRDYMVTLKDAEGCITGKAVTIGSDIAPPTVTPTKTSVCIGDSATLSASAGVSYLWSPNGETSQSITIADSGKYTVTVTDANGCSAPSPEITITLNPAPIVDLGVDSMTVCKNAKVILGTVAVPGNSYSWSSSTGFTSSKAMPEVSATNTTMYKLTVTRNGCQATDSLTLHMEDPMTFFIPSAFSPNEDGKNEEFKVESLGITKFNGTIFNIWGELIYEWDTVDGVWNGTYMDKPVQEGVYVYNIHVQDKCTKENMVKTGVVTLLR